VTRGRVYLPERLEPGGETALDWVVKPARRGEQVVELAAVGSLFPFGFLRKHIGVALRQTVLVWPAQVAYRWTGGAVAAAGAAGRRTSRPGSGDDLLALRRYGQGDSHRLIHWKASARLGQLMVRQFAAEGSDGFVLRLDAPAELWPHPEQFELLCGFAGTLAEDLFAAGRLRGFCVNGGPERPVRRLRDVEAFLDELALLYPGAAPAAGGGERGGEAGPNIIRFAPDGARGVSAWIDGRQAASA
jgi:uncharacterized protein (DUF58 family)